MLETGRGREGHCLKGKDDYGKKAKSHERVYASSERASSPKSSTVKLEEYLFLERDGIEEINSQIRMGVWDLPRITKFVK